MDLPGRRVYFLRLTAPGGALDGKQGAHVREPFSIRFRGLCIQDAVREIRSLSGEMVCLQERLVGNGVAMPKLHSDGSLETETRVGHSSPSFRLHGKMRIVRAEAGNELRKPALRKRSVTAMLSSTSRRPAVVAETLYRDRLDRLGGKDMARGIQAIDADVLQGVAPQ